MFYSGPERRIHTVYKTLNREYHVRAGVCVAVRDCKTKIWISNHEAIGMDLEVNLPGEYYLGKPLLFLSPYAGLQTSKVVDYARPELSTVDTYGIVWAVCPS
jgi:hypothetical protein